MQSLKFSRLPMEKVKASNGSWDGECFILHVLKCSHIIREMNGSFVIIYFLLNLKEPRIEDEKRENMFQFIFILKISLEI